MGEFNIQSEHQLLSNLFLVFRLNLKLLRSQAQSGKTNMKATEVNDTKTKKSEEETMTVGREKEKSRKVVVRICLPLRNNRLKSGNRVMILTSVYIYADFKNR